MPPPRRPHDPNRPKPPRANAGGEDKRTKSPSASARDARRAQQHASTRPPAPERPREQPKVSAPDNRRPNAASRKGTKPAYTGRTTTAARPDRVAAAALRADHAERNPRPERPERPAAAARPERTFRPERTGDAPRADRPHFVDRPRDAPRPDRARPPRPSGGKGPRITGRPDQGTPGTRPARAPYGERTGDMRRADRPTPVSRPERPDRPERGERPAFATRADRAGAGHVERPARPDRDARARSASPFAPRRADAVRPARAEAPRRGAARHERIPAAPRSKEESVPGEGQRIAKLLARAGVASRREIERMIEEGRVAISGEVITTPATILKSLHNVTVDGNGVQAAAPSRLFRYHKPAGLLTAERDPAGRLTIYDRLPPGLPRLMPVGRLDLNTEGLLLLTTDGELKRQLELPATGVERTYRARVFGDISQAQLEDLIDGIEIEGVRYGPIDANLERRTGRNGWVEMKLREGKNREVRRVLEYLGLQVSRLIRTAYGPLVLGEMAPGDVDEVRQHDLVAFRKTLK